MIDYDKLADEQERLKGTCPRPKAITYDPDRKLRYCLQNNYTEWAKLLLIHQINFEDNRDI